jgi:hypothetical protein
MTMTLSGDGTITGLVAGGLPDATITSDDLAAGAALNSVSDGVFFRNRIINGDMRIDQRNAGASVSVSTNTTTYITDRFNVRYATGSGLTSQQSTTAPTGFVKSLLITIGTGASASSSANNRLLYTVEGNDISDLAWGTANAKTVTLSFWVRSSLTGTFSFVFQDASAAYNYIGTYTISSANTFEYKTVTIPGPTSGTWNTSNTAGIQILIDLGSGSDFDGSAGWSSTASVRRTSGSVRLVETSGATFYITGVQLEVGSVATPFERRPYGTELSLCQRYFETSYDAGTAVPTNTQTGAIWFCPTGTRLIYSYPFKVTKRASPTTVFYSPADSATGNYRNDTGAANVAVATGGITGTNFLYMYKSSGATDQTECNVHFSVSAEL